MVALDTMWPRRAACLGGNPDDPFPPSIAQQRSFAESVCAHCLVKEECLIDALSRKEAFGVWGGKTERERQQIYRRGVTQYVIDTARNAIAKRVKNR